MTGLDTNVLLRWIIRDPEAPEQERLVAEALSGAGPFVINAVVLAEAAWVLAARAGFDRAALAETVETLLAAPRVRVEPEAAVAAALAGFRTGGGGLADHLIGALNRAAGCDTTLTFDRAAAKSPDFTALA